MLKALSHHCDPGSILPRAICELNLFLPCSEGFSLDSPGFLNPQKSNISKFQFDWHENHLSGVYALNIVIYLKRCRYFMILRPTITLFHDIKTYNYFISRGNA